MITILARPGRTCRVSGYPSSCGRGKWQHPTSLLGTRPIHSHGQSIYTPGSKFLILGSLSQSAWPELACDCLLKATPRRDRPIRAVMPRSGVRGDPQQVAGLCLPTQVTPLLSSHRGSGFCGHVRRILREHDRICSYIAAYLRPTAKSPDNVTPTSNFVTFRVIPGQFPRPVPPEQPHWPFFAPLAIHIEIC